MHDIGRLDRPPSRDYQRFSKFCSFLTAVSGSLLIDDSAGASDRSESSRERQTAVVP